MLDVRYGAGDANLYRTYAAELASLKPDVVVTGGQAVKAVQQQTQTPCCYWHRQEPGAPRGQCDRHHQWVFVDRRQVGAIAQGSRAQNRGLRLSQMVA
jgi:hypothetical protein